MNDFIFVKNFLVLFQQFDLFVLEDAQTLKVMIFVRDVEQKVEDNL